MRRASNRTPLPLIPRISRTISVGPLGSVPTKDDGCPTSRSFFARCGIPQLSTNPLPRLTIKAQGIKQDTLTTHTTHTTHITHHFRRPFGIWTAPKMTGAPHLARFSRDVGYHGFQPSTPWTHDQCAGHQTGHPYHAYHAYHAPFPSALWDLSPPKMTGAPHLARFSRDVGYHGFQPSTPEAHDQMRRASNRTPLPLIPRISRTISVGHRSSVAPRENWTWNLDLLRIPSLPRVAVGSQTLGCQGRYGSLDFGADMGMGSGLVAPGRPSMGPLEIL